MNTNTFTNAIPALKGMHYPRKHPGLDAGPAAVYAWADEQSAALIRRRNEAGHAPKTDNAARTVPCPECGGRGWIGTGKTWADKCDNPGCRLGRIDAADLVNPPCPICRGAGATRRDGFRVGDPDFGKAAPCSCPVVPVTAGGASMVNRFALGAAGMPAKYHGLTLGTWASDVAAGQGADYDHAGKLARALMDGTLPSVTINRAGLIIIGAAGRGKSGLAAGVLREFMAAGRSARWVPFFGYCDQLNAIRNDGGNDRDTLMRDAQSQFLVIDDLGSEGKGTDHRTRVLLEILEARAGRPTIITTMHGFDKLLALYGDHNVGRIIEGFEPVHLDGRDIRAGA